MIRPELITLVKGDYVEAEYDERGSINPKKDGEIIGLYSITPIGPNMNIVGITNSIVTIPFIPFKSKDGIIKNYQKIIDDNLVEIIERGRGITESYGLDYCFVNSINVIPLRKEEFEIERTIGEILLRKPANEVNDGIYYINAFLQMYKKVE